MTFTALQVLKVAGEDGVLRTIHPGDTIEDFSAWPYATQQAMLRLGRVRNNASDQRYVEVRGGSLHLATPSTPAAAAPEPQPTLEPSDAACHYCERTFATEAGRNRHVARSHKDRP